MRNGPRFVVEKGPLYSLSRGNLIVAVLLMYFSLRSAVQGRQQGRGQRAILQEAQALIVGFFASLLPGLLPRDTCHDFPLRELIHSHSYSKLPRAKFLAHSQRLMTPCLLVPARSRIRLRWASHLTPLYHKRCHKSVLKLLSHLEQPALPQVST